MAFTFGQQTAAKPAFGQTPATGLAFGQAPAPASAAPAFSFGPTVTGSTSGLSFGQPASSASSGFSFGQPTSSTGFSFGQPAAIPSSSGFSFGQPASSASTGFSFAQPASTSGFSFGSFGAKTTAATGLTFSLPTTAAQPFSFGQSLNQPMSFLPTQQAAVAVAPGNYYQSLLLSLTQPQLLGDERDAIIAKFNQFQAYWGSGKGYFSNTQQPIDYTQDNPFCSCLPTTKDADGLVSLLVKKPDEEVQKLQQNLIQTFQAKLLQNKPNFLVSVHSIRASLSDPNKTDVVIYVLERNQSTGRTQRIRASELHQYLSQPQFRTIITNELLCEAVIPHRDFSDTTLESYLANPPNGLDPLLWEQAKKSNPDGNCFIPVPVIGASNLHQRIKDQEVMSNQHLRRLDIISETICQLTKQAAATRAKVQESKRRSSDQSHRLLKLISKQEITRKKGWSILPQEELLAVAMETISGDLIAPSSFKGRLNEALSQVRMVPDLNVSRSAYTMDSRARSEIRQFLKEQQEGVAQLVAVLNKDIKDVNLIVEGLDMKLESK